MVVVLMWCLLAHCWSHFEFLDHENKRTNLYRNSYQVNVD